MKYIDGNDNSGCVLHNICELNKEFEENWNKIEQNKNDVLKVKHVKYKSNDFKYSCAKRDKSLQKLKNVIERTRCNFYKRQLTDINNESMFESFIKEKKLQMKKQLESEGNSYKYNNNINKKSLQEKKSFLIYEQNKHSDIPTQKTTIKPMYIKMIKQHKQNIKSNGVSHKDSPIYNKIRSIYNELSTNVNSPQRQDHKHTNNNNNNINYKDYNHNNNKCTLLQNININNISLKDLHIHFNDIFTSITPNMKISKQFPSFTRSKTPFIHPTHFSNKTQTKTTTPTSSVQTSHTLQNKNSKHRKQLIYTKKICLKSNSNVFYKSTPTLSNIITSTSHIN